MIVTGKVLRMEGSGVVIIRLNDGCFAAALPQDLDRNRCGLDISVGDVVYARVGKAAQSGEIAWLKDIGRTPFQLAAKTLARVDAETITTGRVIVKDAVERLMEARLKSGCDPASSAVKRPQA